MKNIPFKSLILFFVFFVAGIAVVHQFKDEIFIEREIASINASKINNMKFLEQESLQKELNSKLKFTRSSQKKKKWSH